jgi:phospholipid-binding lipoprotein MlaA
MRDFRKLLGVLLAAMALCGCASQGLQIRRLPSETPAADNAAAIEYTAALAAAVNAETEEGARSAPAGEPKPITVADVPPMQTSDPWERLNRFTYRFNARFDEAVFLPVANGYRRLPSPLRAGVHNFFGNLAEVDSVINYILQWHLGYSARSLGRFVINSTLGIGGLIDVAKHLKLASVPTGFTTTLGKWGVPLGPYVVLPLLGPSTLRDGVGWLGDYGAEYGVDVAHLYRGYQSYGLGVANAVDQRAGLDFRYYSTGSPFEYETIRFLYVHKRLIEDQALHAKKTPAKRSSDAAAQ